MFSFSVRTLNSAMKIRCCCFQRNLFTAAAPPPSSMPPLQLPSPMETHFWYVLPEEVNDASLLNQYMDILSPCEKQNVLRLSSHVVQKRALLARALVRTTIARYQINGHVDPRSFEFRKNAHGKPEVDWGVCKDGGCKPLLHFNISHTSSLVACGVTMNSPIGIDVEEKERKLKNNVLALARRYFSAHEVERLISISDSDVQRREFIKLWTLKEAYVKALGRGFSATPFNTFTICMKNFLKGALDLPEDFDSEASEIMVESFHCPKNFIDNWQFALLELAASHYVAVCIQKDKTSEVGTSLPMRLTAWKTIPFIEDVCVSGTDAVVPIGGLVKQF